MHMTTQNSPAPRLARSRWAAFGAAVAVALGAGGGFGLANAVQDSGERSTYTPISPCRLADTRSNNQIGPRNVPIGPDEVYTIAARGEQGQCVAADLPDDATALVLNVTALGATSQTFLTFWPDGDRPEAASLNPSVGAPPIPNAVTTALASDGSFKIYNERGDVNVVIDVAGFYTDHNHDDRYYTKTEIDDRNYTKSESDERYYDRATTEALIAIAGLRIGTIAVAAPEFSHRASPAEYEMTGGGIWIPNGEDGYQLEAGVSLPDGARLGELRATVYDNIGPNDLRVELVRYDDAGVRTIIGVANSSGTSGDYLEWVSKTLIDEQVDNDNYSYVLEASARLSSNSNVTAWPHDNIRLLKVEVQYAD
jgi:hypothetical protein